MTDISVLARIFKALSVDVRIQIIDILRSKPLCVNALARSLNITSAAVSQHLRILRDLDIVKPERRGYFVHYRLNMEKMEEWGRLTQIFLNGDRSASHRQEKDVPEKQPGDAR
jgi:ArsR family transcriptional regulator, arsenate/arsenite/antimonite-responsive transcriptional repressor